MKYNASQIIVIYYAKKKSCVRYIPKTFLLLFHYFWNSNWKSDGWRIESIKINLCNCLKLVSNLLTILLSFDCQVEIRSVELAIYIFFFSIAIFWLSGEAQSAELAIQILYLIWLLRWCWFCNSSFLPIIIDSFDCWIEA